VALVLGIVLTIVVFVVIYMWRYFVFAVAILSPLGALSDVMYGLALAVGLLGLFATLVLHIITLFFWKRLIPPQQRRPLILWGIGLVALIVLPVVFHVVYGQQRFTWLEDRRDEWQAEASTNTLYLGANTGFSLGYTFALIG
jgi:membrane protease YdiL (CAAX protease family)